MLAGTAAGVCALVIGLPVPAGVATMGAALIVGAVIRLRISDRRAGALAVRSRRMDAVVLGGLGAALLIAALLLLLPLHG